MTSSYRRTVEADDGFRDYYADLGVAWNAPLVDLERAYRRLVIANHPDRFAHDPHLRRHAEARLKDLNAAMGMLRDHVRRAHYNQRFRREKPLTARLTQQSVGDL